MIKMPQRALLFLSDCLWMHGHRFSVLLLCLLGEVHASQDGSRNRPIFLEEGSPCPEHINISDWPFCLFS